MCLTSLQLHYGGCHIIPYGENNICRCARNFRLFEFYYYYVAIVMMLSPCTYIPLANSTYILGIGVAPVSEFLCVAQDDFVTHNNII